jgi:regulatory protein YycH of two-component signal transduction system YycFG
LNYNELLNKAKDYLVFGSYQKARDIAYSFLNDTLVNDKLLRMSAYKLVFESLRSEKMYEELLLDSKSIIKTSNDKIYIEKTEFINFNQENFYLVVKMANENQSSISNYLFENLFLLKF